MSGISREGSPWLDSEQLGVKGTQADFDNARSTFPIRSQEEWMELFDRAPHVLHNILGDIFRETKAEAERESGKARIGRRPKVISGSLDELTAMITPQYSMDPFGVAVKPFIEKSPSLRAFAAKVPMNHHTLTRLMRGTLPLERWRLEAIASAAKVHPAYFVEYREMFVVEAVSTYLRARPNVSISFTKQLAKAGR